LLIQFSILTIPYPPYIPRTKTTNGKQLIFCELRKIWIRFTPEEWVRQNFLQYLIQIKNYPASLIAVEKEITVGELKKRFDILVYKNDQPWMVIECKEQDTMLTETIIKQILSYYSVLQTNYLVITNGNQTECFSIMNSTIKQVEIVPEYKKSESN
jgi:hypothetical protein